MIGFTVTSDAPEVAAALRDVSDGLEDELEQVVSEATEYLQSQLQALAPVGKAQPGRAPGRLKGSIRGETDGLTGTFTAADYAWYVIGGTSPHTISGNPLLAFEWDKAGGYVVFASVHHPGSAPNDFRLPALMSAADEAEGMLDALADWVGDTLTG